MRDHGLEPFRSGVARFHGVVPEYTDRCPACVADPICDHGCQAFVLRSPDRANIGCAPTLMRHTFYSENRKNLIPVFAAICERPEYSFANAIPVQQAALGGW